MTHGKHVGSKPHRNLKNAVRSMSKARELYNRMKKAAEERQELSNKAENTNN